MALKSGIWRDQAAAGCEGTGEPLIVRRPERGADGEGSLRRGGGKTTTENATTIENRAVKA
jgi:hypothetical protein